MEVGQVEIIKKKVNRQGTPEDRFYIQKLEPNPTRHTNETPTSLK